MHNATKKNAPQNSLSASPKPMPLWQAVLYFGIPALLFRICLYAGIPALIGLGMSPFHANVVAFTVPAAILFAAAFGFYKLDGYPLRWRDICERFRLVRMTGGDWLWALGGLIITFLSIGAVQFTALLLIRSVPAIAPPDFFAPWLKPGATFDVAQYAQYIGNPIKGNWGAVSLVFVMFFFNIFGEELWWRGYILPRQEPVHGRGTWAIHGILWLLWHAVFYPWQLIALLPICLVLPYIAQRRQNTWVAIIIHLQNGVFQVLVLLMVLGVL